MTELQKAVEAKLLSEILEAEPVKRVDLICQYETFAQAVLNMTPCRH